VQRYDELMSLTELLWGTETLC